MLPLLVSVKAGPEPVTSAVMERVWTNSPVASTPVTSTL